MKILLKDATTDALAAHIVPLGGTLRLARRMQGIALKHRLAALPERLKDIKGATWQTVRQACDVPHLEVVDRAVSPTDGFTKYLFRGAGPELFEAVRIPLMHRPGDEKYVVCVSSQVGCAVGCAFCATGKLGFKRQLATWEIVDQVCKIQEDSPHPVRGVVFMGMGEPFLNYQRVLTAAEIFTDPSGLAIDGKSITISTAGVVPMLERFTAERRQYRLIVSLHSALSETRDALVPLNERYDLDRLFAALRSYQAVMGRRVTLAWTMLPDHNMNRAELQALARRAEGLRYALDLIPFQGASDRFRRPTPAEENAFLDLVRLELNAPFRRRYSGGEDVQGACGMLAGQRSSEQTTPHLGGEQLG